MLFLSRFRRVCEGVLGIECGGKEIVDKTCMWTYDLIKG